MHMQAHRLIHVYAGTQAHTYICRHTGTYKHMQAHRHIQAYAGTQAHTYICRHTGYIHAYAGTRTHTCICRHTYTYMHMQAHVHIHAYVSTHTHTCICRHTYTYMHFFFFSIWIFFLGYKYMAVARQRNLATTTSNLEIYNNSNKKKKLYNTEHIYI